MHNQHSNPIMLNDIVPGTTNNFKLYCFAKRNLESAIFDIYGAYRLRS